MPHHTFFFFNVNNVISRALPPKEKRDEGEEGSFHRGMGKALSSLLFVMSSSLLRSRFFGIVAQRSPRQRDVCESVALQGLNHESLFCRKANNNSDVLMFVKTEHQSHHRKDNAIVSG